MFPQLFKIKATELSNRFENLALVVPDTAQFISDRFDSNITTEKVISLFDNYFLNFISKTSFDNDSRLYEAIDIILKTPEL